jgi:hypothetical protein
MVRLARTLSRVCFLFGLCAALALSQTNTGSLSGRVTDPSSAVVTGARVVANNDETGVSTSTTTSADGFYSFPSLPVGPYTVQAEQPGFKMTRQTGVVLAVASNSTVNLSLTVGEASQTVSVTGDAPLLATQTSETGTVFQPKFMRDAPLFVSGGFRNPETFISYMPGREQRSAGFQH